MLYGLVCLLTGSGKGYVNTYRLLLAVACLRLRAVCLVPFLWLALTQRAGEPQDLGMAWICCWHGREVGGGVHFKGGWYVCMGVFVSLVGGYVWVSQSVGWVCVCACPFVQCVHFRLCLFNACNGHSCRRCSKLQYQERDFISSQQKRKSKTK